MLPTTGYIKMIDIWMIFTMAYPFLIISLHCIKEVCWNFLFVKKIISTITARSGQREPPRLVLEVGGASTLQAAMRWADLAVTQQLVDADSVNSKLLHKTEYPQPIRQHTVHTYNLLHQHSLLYRK